MISVMTRSDSSDSGRSRKHSKNRKKHNHRSRSNSSSSEDRNRKSKKYKSDRKKDKSDDRRRSKSRERRRSRSRSRSRERKRSRSRERKRSRSRSRSRDRRRSRSHSKDKSRKSKEEASKSHSKQHSSGWDEQAKPQVKNLTGWDAKPSQFKTHVHNNDGSIDEKMNDKLNLKEKIKLLTEQTNPTESLNMPTSEQIGKIDDENFVQQRFSSTYNDPSAQPKQKKKKKKKQKYIEQIQNVIKEQPIDDVNKGHIELISHENAIFGNTVDTLHVSRFCTRIDMKRKEQLKTVETNDLIFGAMFCDKPEVRVKRWITKLTTIQKRLLEEQ